MPAPQSAFGLQIEITSVGAIAPDFRALADGRLYLPYELLYQCNGVLVRWDAKKNTLWVDTRYLRRP